MEENRHQPPRPFLHLDASWLAASFIPAHRAAGVDPGEALRAE
jgi:hypothetical protein